jgi:DNA-binding CsgD family transcriptional regulator
MSGERGDLLAIVEAAYRVDAPDDVWLKDLAEAARPYLDHGFGVAAFEFVRPEGGLPDILQSFRLGIPPALEEVYDIAFRTMDPEIRQRPFILGPCVTGSELMGMGEEFREHPHMKRYAQRVGMVDSIWVTAAEPSGKGCGFHAGMRDIQWASPVQKERWGRLAAHLSTAVRLRHRLKARSVATPPSAVFDPGGKVHEATSGAQEASALEDLQRAVITLEKVRGPMRRDAPDTALACWKTLVQGRWSLVEQLEHDGRRYILARENEPVATGSAALTERERQILGYAKLGHDNKLIAYELGISHSTVRVLLSRAAKKLGVRTRAELLRVPADSSADPAP